MIVGLLSRVDFFSLSFSLSRSLSLVSPLCFFHRLPCALPIVRGMTFFFLFFLSLSLSFFFFFSPIHSTSSFYTNQNFWPMKILLLSFVAQERKNVCMCMYGCCCCFWQVAAVLPEKKNVCAKGRELIKYFGRLLHDLLISQLKSPQTYGNQRKESRFLTKIFPKKTRRFLVHLIVSSIIITKW